MWYVDRLVLGLLWLPGVIYPAVPETTGTSPVSDQQAATWLPIWLCLSRVRSRISQDGLKRNVRLKRAYLKQDG